MIFLSASSPYCRKYFEIHEHHDAGGNVERSEAGVEDIAVIFTKLKSSYLKDIDWFINTSLRWNWSILKDFSQGILL